ncbi:hypothetical protein [Pseudomonas sp. FP1740]|uniref:hypothetical protein n=1 Tax=Pseudomonas sp. FP1740 TaxID=2954078 RepID=UPI002732F913|nr:hypothetical protein [Pseudomonas sp. FP1740]WLG46904.1 hypothetical protein PSH69_09965 [Pseudomonas sp. FP1740]
MKIALAFYGIPRSTTICFPSIQENILNSLPENAEVEFFYHLYEQSKVVNKRSGENGALSPQEYHPFLSFNGGLEKPGECLEKWDFEGVKSFGDVWKDDFNSLSNLIHQLNSLHQVTLLIEDYKPDVTIFLRPDLFYHDPLPKEIFSMLLNDKTSVFIPAWQWWGGYNDRFAVCGADSYKVYGKRICEMVNFCESAKKPLHAEELVKFVITSHKILPLPLNVRASRVRLDGTFKKEIFSSFRGMGGIKGVLELSSSKIKLMKINRKLIV